MKTFPFNPLDYMTRRDAPRFLGWGLLEMLKGRFRLGGRLIRLAVLALAISGCAHSPMVSCITPEQYEQLKSQEPEKVGSRLTGRADEDIRVIAGSNLRLRAYSGTLLDVLKVCAK